MAWQRIARRAGGMMGAIGLLGAIVGLTLYAFYPQRAVQLAIGAMIVGLVGAMILLLTADRLPPGGGPGL